MRIGLSTTLTERGRSGLGQYAVNLIAALVREAARHEIVVFALADDAPHFAFARDAVQLVIVGQTRRRPAPDLVWHHLMLPRLAREHGIDVLHTPTQRRMLWRRPCGLVVTVHDVGAFRIPRDPASRGSCPATVFRRLARRQDEIVTPSQHAATALCASLGADAPRVTAVPCGVDHQIFSPGGRGEAATMVAHRYALRPPFFLHVAPLEVATGNHRRLITAFNAFKTRTPSPWQLVLIGPDGGGADRIRESVLRSPYAPDIHCLGFVPAEEMPQWYRAAGALVYLPLRWGFGLPLLEAMASDCPVLTADHPAAREVCGDAALYLNANDTSCITAALTTLAAEPGLRARLVDAGRARSTAFDWRTTASAMLEVYARAARRAKSAAMVTPQVTTTAHSP
jgi:glycosyltransferase involved in cell wall biosynthesis